MAEEETKQESKPDYSLNQLVFIILAILTFGEFMFGTIATTNITTVFLTISVVKAGFILVYYMNVGRLFSSEEGGHE